MLKYLYDWHHASLHPSPLVLPNQPFRVRFHCFFFTLHIMTGTFNHICALHLFHWYMSKYVFLSCWGWRIYWIYIRVWWKWSPIESHRTSREYVGPENVVLILINTVHSSFDLILLLPKLRKKWGYGKRLYSQIDFTGCSVILCFFQRF